VWSCDDAGARIAVGGADRTVTVWEMENGKILYKIRIYRWSSGVWLNFFLRFLSPLPGHKGTVTCVDFHPKEQIGE
jgi:Prp8 binding protein